MIKQCFYSKIIQITTIAVALQSGAIITQLGAAEFEQRGHSLSSVSRVTKSVSRVTNFVVGALAVLAPPASGFSKAKFLLKIPNAHTTINNNYITVANDNRYTALLCHPSNDNTPFDGVTDEFKNNHSEAIAILTEPLKPEHIHNLASEFERLECYKESFYFYCAAHIEGCLKSALHLGTHYYGKGLGNIVPVNQTIAFDYIAYAAQNGLPETFPELAIRYMKGIGTKFNITNAVAAYKKGAELDDPCCLFVYGIYTFRGSFGIEKNQALGISLVKHAVDKGLTNEQKKYLNSTLLRIKKTRPKQRFY